MTVPCVFTFLDLLMNDLSKMYILRHFCKSSVLEGMACLTEERPGNKSLLGLEIVVLES